MSLNEEKESPEKEFASNTTLHGLNRIVIAPSSYFRVLWVVVILASYGGFGYMFGSMIYTYFSYDTITDTKLQFSEELTFPAITVCNMNKFDARKLTVSDWVYLSMLLYGVQQNVSTILANGVPADDTVNSTMNFTGRKLEDVVLEKGFDISLTRMKICVWKGTLCSYLNFTHSYSPFGNCYTFNADPVNPLKQTMEGAGNGFLGFFDIFANDYTEDYFTGGSSEIGLKLLLHDQREPAMMDSHGIALAPGGHAFIAIKRTLYENHIPPWGVCQDLQLEYYDTYTLPACYLECRSKHVTRNCGCRPFYLPGTAPSCDPATMFSCVTYVIGQVVKGELKCDCPVPCSMTKYSASVSYAGWPNKRTKDNIAATYGLDEAYMAENGVVFSVFYEELNYVNIRELKAMDGGQLASNIGGMMGLFLGGSLLTLLEVWEYLWQRLLGLLGRNRHTPTNNVKTNSNDFKLGSAIPT